MAVTVETLSAARRALARAADLIDQRGHCTGAYEDDDGRLCAAGALRVAVFGAAYPAVTTSAQWRLYYVAKGLLLIRAGHRYDDVIGWSDRSTQADVVAGLRLAAEAG